MDWRLGREDSANRVVGILSERDILRALAERGAAALDTCIDRAMTRSAVTCTETMTVSEVMKRMTAQQVPTHSGCRIWPPRRHRVDRGRSQIPAGDDAARVSIDA
jgi:CBS domain-containing protein